MTTNSLYTSTKKPTLEFSKLFYPNLQRELVGELLTKHGDFLLRRAGDGGRVLSVNKNGEIVHFKFGPLDDRIHMPGKTFDTLESMVVYHFETGLKVAGRDDVDLITPIYNVIEMVEFSRLHLLQELGRGNFGQVWRATLSPDLTSSVMKSEEVAVKILAENSSEKDRAECMAEARLMSALAHDNIVRFLGLSVWTQAGNASPPKLLIILEYCNKGSLDKLLEKDAIGKRGKEKALLDAAKGIEYLHSRKVLHRDIASRNCLVQAPENKREFTVKIGDFGLSRLTDGGHYKLVTKRRLPIFSTPPETLKTRDWTSSSDVWSFGILMQEVYNAGRNPYDAHFGNAPLKQIVTELNDGFRLPPPKGMPPELAQLSVRCMAKEPERPKMSDVVAELARFYNRSSAQ